MLHILARAHLSLSWTPSYGALWQDFCLCSSFGLVEFPFLFPYKAACSTDFRPLAQMARNHSLCFYEVSKAEPEIHFCIARWGGCSSSRKKEKRGIVGGNGGISRGE